MDPRDELAWIMMNEPTYQSQNQRGRISPAMDGFDPREPINANPISERLNVLPFGRYQMPDGSKKVDLAWPDILTPSPGMDRPEDGFKMVLGSRMPGKAPTGAVGSSGGRLPKGSGLNMSQEARLARARDMGFDTDTVYFHGSPRSGDIARSGFGDNGNHPGFFFSKDRAVADGYSGVDLVPERTYERNSILQKLRIAPPSKTIEMRPYDPLATGQAGVIPAYLRLGRTKDIDAADIGRGVSFQDLQKQAIAEGYDSARLVMDGVTHETIVFDPRNIRSVNAAFDPAKKDSANLLASRAGFPMPPAWDRNELASLIMEQY